MSSQEIDVLISGLDEDSAHYSLALQMKGIYIARLDLARTENIGVSKKIHAQIKALGNSFSSVDLFCLSSARISLNNRTIRKISSGKIRERLRHYMGFYAYLAHANLKSDFFYIRYQKCDPFLIYMLVAFKLRFPSSPVLIEIPSYPYEQEYDSTRDRFLYVTDRLTRWALRFFVNYVVTFSRADQIFGIKTIQINNGVDLQGVRPVLPPDSVKILRLVGVANVSYWYGYDRVISGLTHYYSGSPKQRVIFDIVGDGAEVSNLKEATKRAGLQDSVRFYGSLDGNELDQLLSRCHMGISSIGLHRHKMDSSTIKSAEYCAAGIPFVMSPKDRCLPVDAPFVHKVKDSDEPVDICRLLDFYISLRKSYPQFAVDMRAYAERHLSWNTNMEPVTTAILEYSNTHQ